MNEPSKAANMPVDSRTIELCWAGVRLLNALECNPTELAPYKLSAQVLLCADRLKAALDAFGFEAEWKGGDTVTDAEADALLARFLAWWCEKQGISPFAEGEAAQWVAQFRAEERGEYWEEEATS